MDELEKYKEIRRELYLLLGSFPQGFPINLENCLDELLQKAYKQGAEDQRRTWNEETYNKGKAEALMWVRNHIVGLRREYVNTPLDKRENGWEWLSKLEALIIKD